MLTLMLLFLSADPTPFDQERLNTLNAGVQEVYSAVLNQDGTVNWPLLKKDKALMDKLKAFQAYAETIAPTDIPDEKARLAHLANVYNVYTLVGVTKAWPVASVRKIHPLFGFFTRNKFVVGGEKVSLNDIENKMLRPMDHRVHFVINCASASCPPLPRTVLTAENVDRIMDESAAAFLADETKNRYDKATGIWHLSQIFDWFKDDWGGEAGVIAFVKKVHPVVDWDPKKIKHIDYNWDLNGPTTP